MSSGRTSAAVESDRRLALPRQGSFHYGSVIVVAGFLTVFASLGLARFGLGMLLPSMGADLNLTYS